MPNFFHHPNITSEAAKECSQKISDYHERKNDDIEKIKFDPVKGMNIYSARLNKKRRCIYATSDHNDYVFILYLAEDHDYKKALRKVDGLNASSLTGFRLLNNERCCLGIFPKTDNKLELSKKTFVFDEIQSSALSDDPSNTYLISGPPGSGKTLVMYARLLKEEPETKVLYLASSPHLVRATHLAYNQDSPDNASVEFQTWDELLKPFFNKKDISSNEFEQWYSKNSGKLGKKYSSKVIHDEIGLYAALKKDKYEQLGKLGSALLEEERSTLMRLYEGWQQHLGERVDLAINHFESLREELSKYQSIYIDEAQNFSPMGLRQLMEFSPSDCSVTVALDPYQNLESSPYIVPCLNQLLNQYRQNGLKETALLDVKRSPKEVMAVARHVMKEANNYFDFSPKSLLQINGSNAHKSFADEAKAENDEIIYWIEEKTKRVNDVYGKSHSQSDPTEPTLKNARSRYGDTPKTVVIAFKVLQEEEKQRINSCFGTSYILSPEEAIGLEYDTVILWHPLTDCPPNLKNKLSKGAQSADRNEMMEYRPVFNALFVALTRACRRVILYDNLSTKVHEDLSSLLFPEVVKKIKAPEVSSSSAPDVVPVEKASDSEWIKRALAHLQRGKEEVAKSILVGQLKWSMEKFAQWVKLKKIKYTNP